MGNGVWGACTPSLPIKRDDMRSGGISGAGEQGTRATLPPPLLAYGGHRAG